MATRDTLARCLKGTGIGRLRSGRTLFSLSIIALLLVSNPAFFMSPISPAKAAGVILSGDDGGISSNHQIAVADANIYVVWEALAAGQNDVFFASSSNDGADFGDSVNLSNSGTASSPRIAVSGSSVHVVWQNTTASGTDIVLASSVDDAANFDTAAISDTGSTSTGPQVSATGDSVYAVWQQDVSGKNDILIASSGDSGATIGDPVNLSNNAGDSTLPQLAVSGSNVSVVWQDDSIGTIDILHSSSSDSGGNFSSFTNVSNNTEASTSPQVALSSEGDVFVVWSDAEFGSLEILLAVSNDSGNSFDTPTNLSGNSGNSRLPLFALAGDGVNAHVVWQDFSTGTAEIMVQAGLSPEGPSIVLSPVSNTEPIWGIDGVTASGSVSNAAVDDKVLVDWGDGTSEEALISESSWESTEHIYDGSAVGENTIVARLLASDDSEKAASSSAVVNVLTHPTTLTLNQIPSVFQGQQVSVGGSILDAITEEPLAGMTITFDGSGGDSLDPATSDAGGLYSSAGVTQNTTGQGHTVQAHFEGDNLFNGTDSAIRTFDTIDLSAEEFAVATGFDQHVDLAGFGTSVDFAEVATDGSLFVSECSAPASDRYIAIGGGCVSMSPGFQLGEGSLALVNMNYSGLAIPAGITPSDFAIFRESGNGEIVDVTLSVDQTAQLVVGQVSGFSNFILGVAIHDVGEGQHGTQIYVGDDNAVSLRDINNIDPASFNIEIDDVTPQGATLIVQDLEGNVDSSQPDIVKAGIMSDTSDPVIVELTLTENAASSGVFEQAFVLSSGTSTIIGGPLQAESGDTISPFYIPGARFSADIDGVTEADTVLLSDLNILTNCNPVGEELVFNQPIGNGVELELLHSDFGPGTTITATMSYANAELGNITESSLKMFHRVGSQWSDITLTSDTDAKTVTGLAISEGVFSLGITSDSCVGGVGGGFGRGLVVDAVAKVAKESTSSGSGGGGGGGGSRSAVAVSTSQSGSSNVQSGEDVSTITELSPRTGFLGGRVMLSFDNVVMPGTIRVEEQQLSSSQGMFTSFTADHGSIKSLDGSQFSTAGPIFDIETNGGLQFQGMVDVTIPYNEAMATSAFATRQFPEDDVRFMHYDGSGWTDLTVRVDTVANTVTGRMPGFSQVVAAVSEDGTFGEQYFAEHPMKRLTPVMDQGNADSKGITFADRQGNSVLTASGGQDITVVTTIKNPQRVSQDYVYLMEVFDSGGVVVEIDIITGRLDSTQAEMIQQASLHVEGDDTAYTIKVFLISVDKNPELLADVMVAQLPVVNTP